VETIIGRSCWWKASKCWVKHSGIAKDRLKFIEQHNNIPTSV
jgi:hypothetical protein